MEDEMQEILAYYNNMRNDFNNDNVSFDDTVKRIEDIEYFGISYNIEYGEDIAKCMVSRGLHKGILAFHGRYKPIITPYIERSKGIYQDRHIKLG